MEFRRNPRLYNKQIVEKRSLRPLPVTPVKQKKSFISRALYPVVMIATYGLMFYFNQTSPTMLLFPLIMLIPALVVPAIEDRQNWKEAMTVYNDEIIAYNEYLDALDLEFEQIKQYYIEGISWVFEYYYNGCVSWGWFYPFHYAPFASDLTELTSIKVNFTKGKPFQPFEQLLSVLPPYSAASLPKCLQKYMTDPLSEIIDFYPNHIKLDINNQPYAWMGVNLIPFIDENRIRKILKEKTPKN